MEAIEFNEKEMKAKLICTIPFL